MNLAQKEHLIKSGLMKGKDGKKKFEYVLNEPKEKKLWRPSMVTGNVDYSTQLFDGDFSQS